MRIFRPINAFTLLVVILAFAFTFRLVNIFSHRGPSDDIGVFSSANAVEAKPATAQPASDEPPPLTQTDIDKAVKDAAKQADLETTPEVAPRTGNDNVPAPPIFSRAFTASELDVLQSLSKRRDELEKRERRLADREALLSAAEQEVDEKVKELNKLKGEIEGLLGKQQQMEDARINSLVKIYEAMKPKEAAVIFNTLNLEVLLSVISRMSERKSSPVLAAMDPDKARIVTIRLAEQRKLPSLPVPEEGAAAPVTAPSLKTTAETAP
ncbi:MAG: MotE family protein [Alphaproteobacteria bacterium]